MRLFRQNKIIQFLKTSFQDRFIIERALLEAYKTDESGETGTYPLGIVFPETTEEVSEIVKACSASKIHFLVRGKGTGKTGGAIPLTNCLIISMERMNQFLIEPENMLAVAGPGVITNDLQKAAAEKGLFYPVDPASLDMCSIGGNIAENAGGPRAFKYGVTRDYVLGLEVVLPNGKILQLGGKTRKNVTGYNLKDLIIGSEGTLAVITKAYLKLIPLPKERFLLWAVYDDFYDAVSSIAKVYASGIAPSLIEFIESRALKAVEKLTQLAIPNSESPAHLLIEVDGFQDQAVLKEAEDLSRILTANKAKEVLAIPYENKQDQIWEIRRKISEATKFVSYNKASEDIVVPPAELKNFLSELKKIEERYGVEVICFGHLGDGNVHVNILNVSDETGEVWKSFKNQVIAMIFSLVKKYQGTLSGEHGIGITKKQYLQYFIDSESMKIHKKIKKIFDPHRLLNRNKIF